MARALLIWVSGALFAAAIVGLLELQSATMLSDKCVRDVQQRGILALCMGPPDVDAYLAMAGVLALSGLTFARSLLLGRARLSADRAR